MVITTITCEKRKPKVTDTRFLMHQEPANISKEVGTKLFRLSLDHSGSTGGLPGFFFRFAPIFSGVLLTP